MEQFHRLNGYFFLLNVQKEKPVSAVKNNQSIYFISHDTVTGMAFLWEASALKENMSPQLCQTSSLIAELPVNIDFPAIPQTRGLKTGGSLKLLKFLQRVIGDQ